MTGISIRRGDGHRGNYQRKPFKVILDNMRSARNVGAIMRTSDAAGAGELILCGTTAIPPHKKIEQTAMGAEKYLQWRYEIHTLPAVKILKQQGLPIVVMETTTRSKNIWEVNYPRNLVLVCGNEALGIGEGVLELADYIVEIPMFGYKNSLNVASAFSVVVYEMIR
ncbi:MAG: RNA methyltransferase, partial [bacterium]